MREICQSGSEGGEAGTPAFPTPIRVGVLEFMLWKKREALITIG